MATKIGRIPNILISKSSIYNQQSRGVRYRTKTVYEHSSFVQHAPKPKPKKIKNKPKPLPSVYMGDTVVVTGRGATYPTKIAHPAYIFGKINVPHGAGEVFQWLPKKDK